MSGESLPSGVLKVAEECKRLLDVHAVSMTLGGRQILHSAIDQLAALASPPPQATGAQEWEARMSSDGKRVVLDSADFKHDAALILNGDFESPDQRMNYARGLAAKLNALSSAKREAEPQWLPIESAPRDGTNILLVNRKGNMATGLWMNSSLGIGWWLRGGIGPDAFFNGHFGPTHWMPLPTAPQEEANHD